MCETKVFLIVALTIRTLAPKQKCLESTFFFRKSITYRFFYLFEFHVLNSQKLRHIFPLFRYVQSRLSLVVWRWVKMSIARFRGYLWNSQPRDCSKIWIFKKIVEYTFYVLKAASWEYARGVSFFPLFFFELKSEKAMYYFFRNICGLLKSHQK